MWKSFLDSLIEALAMMDPLGYAYYVAHKQGGEVQSIPTQDREPRHEAHRATQRRLRRGEEVSA